MAAATHSEFPQFQRHKTTGHARVKIDGQEFWLGPADSPQAREKYDRVIAEWLANGRSLSPECAGPKQFTVSEVILEYMKFAEQQYQKNGEPTKEYLNLKTALRFIQRLYGSTPTASFGPRALVAVRHAMINQHLMPEVRERPLKPLSRRYVNDMVKRIRRMFRWAVKRELIPPSVEQALGAVEGLRKGRGGVETDKITIVPEAFIEAVKPFVNRQVWGLIQLQLCTGMRPGEAICLRVRDLNMSGRLWEIAPTDHKTAHFGIDRTILVGPKGQEVLKPFLKSSLEECLFSPQDAQEERYAAQRAARKTKVQPSQQCRKLTTPQRQPEKCYSIDGYRRAIHRACDAANRKALQEKADNGQELPTDDRLIPRWSPNRLRHNFATRMRREYGIETARILLGHTSASTTEIYAEADRMKAVKVMEEVG